MRGFLTKIYYQTRIGTYLIQPILNLRNFVIPEKVRLQQRFKRLLGYPLNLKSPKTLNEKIQWLKLYDRTPLHTICADKYTVRSHIKEKIGEQYLIPLIFHTKNPDDIIPQNLPNYPVIIKTNHDSSGGIFVRDKNTMDWKTIHKKLKRHLKQNYDTGKGEWQYRNIAPRILVEKLLMDEHGSIPSDYKLHCFNGKLTFTQVDIDRQTDHKRNLYDAEWNFIDCEWKYKNGVPVKKPDVFEEMRGIAEKLATDFIYVRVDLYYVKEAIYFGELTFHSESGNGSFKPIEWDRKLGDLLELPIEK
ncbi:ATP-grasp fold amidoligase family protein [Leptobacterium sp. I13]|uniref:ATP-grasp fold amidoligase family protein n=1 Tax=Leptobacterium meishanense TaxID=3128904 RepID=UPI0030EF4D94